MAVPLPDPPFIATATFVLASDGGVASMMSVAIPKVLTGPGGFYVEAYPDFTVVGQTSVNLSHWAWACYCIPPDVLPEGWAPLAEDTMLAAGSFWWGAVVTGGEEWSRARVYDIGDAYLFVTVWPGDGGWDNGWGVADPPLPFAPWAPPPYNEPFTGWGPVETFGGMRFYWGWDSMVGNIDGGMVDAGSVSWATIDVLFQDTLPADATLPVPPAVIWPDLTITTPRLLEAVPPIPAAGMSAAVRRRRRALAARGR